MEEGRCFFFCFFSLGRGGETDFVYVHGVLYGRGVHITCTPRSKHNPKACKYIQCTHMLYTPMYTRRTNIDPPPRVSRPTFIHGQYVFDRPPTQGFFAQIRVLQQGHVQPHKGGHQRKQAPPMLQGLHTVDEHLVGCGYEEDDDCRGHRCCCFLGVSC